MEIISMMNSVLQTTNYDMFKIPSWNRNIKQTNLKRIDERVKKEGWLKHPIMVNEKMEVADGQHRLVYAKQHGFPVYYVVVPGLSVNDCVVMNNARMSWNLLDYIKLYAGQGNKNYELFAELLNKYSFCPPTVLVNIIKNTGLSGGTTKSIKDGTLVISEEEKILAIQKLEFLKDCYQDLLSVSGRTSSLISAVSFAYDCPGVDKDRLFGQIRNHANIMTPPAGLDMALKEIETLYNYRNRRDSYVYIYTEYKRCALGRRFNFKKQAEEDDD